MESSYRCPSCKRVSHVGCGFLIHKEKGESCVCASWGMDTQNDNGKITLFKAEDNPGNCKPGYYYCLKWGVCFALYNLLLQNLEVAKDLCIDQVHVCEGSIALCQHKYAPCFRSTYAKFVSSSWWHGWCVLLDNGFYLHIAIKVLNLNLSIEMTRQS